MINQNFIFLAIAFNLIGSLSYVISTLKGKTKPNRVTWFLWALAPLIAFAVQVEKGVGLASLMTFMVGFGPLMVLIASFINKKSYWKITRFDLICGAFSVVGLLVWLVLKQGNIAIAATIFADALAALPSILKAYRHPESESYRIFLFGTTSAVITVLTIQTYDFAHLGFAVYIFIVCSIFVLLGIRANKITGVHK